MVSIKIACINVKTETPTLLFQLSKMSYHELYFDLEDTYLH